jgi:hypothetical protein
MARHAIGQRAGEDADEEERQHPHAHRHADEER